MNRENFQLCCGAEELGNFSGSYLTMKADITVQLQAMKTERELVQEGAYDAASGVVIATTVAEQTAAARALKFHKFRKVFTFKNPGTGNKVTLWAKKLVK